MPTEPRCGLKAGSDPPEPAAPRLGAGADDARPVGVYRRRYPEVRRHPLEMLDHRLEIAQRKGLLLDISLASRDRETPWLRFEEAAELFGHRERAAVRALARRTSLLGGAVGVVVGGLLAVVLASQDVDPLIAVLPGVIVASAAAFGAAVEFPPPSWTPAMKGLLS